MISLIRFEKDNPLCTKENDENHSGLGRAKVRVPSHETLKPLPRRDLIGMAQIRYGTL